MHVTLAYLYVGGRADLIQNMCLQYQKNVFFPGFLKAGSSDLFSSFATFRNTTIYITVHMCSKALGIRSQFSAEEKFLDCLT